MNEPQACRRFPCSSEVCLKGSSTLQNHHPLGQSPYDNYSTSPQVCQTSGIKKNRYTKMQVLSSMLKSGMLKIVYAKNKKVCKKHVCSEAVSLVRKTNYQKVGPAPPLPVKHFFKKRTLKVGHVPVIGKHVLSENTPETSVNTLPQSANTSPRSATKNQRARGSNLQQKLRACHPNLRSKSIHLCKV